MIGKTNALAAGIPAGYHDTSAVDAAAEDVAQGKKIVDATGAVVTGTHVCSGGGTPVPVAKKDINFYDYDGTRVASWTLAELAAATALPANPTHDGLTAQGWNWTLAGLKAENAPMDVGQMYITDDGKTRLYITIAGTGRMSVPLYWQQTVSEGVTIDWGDGSAAETLTGTGNKNTTHTYTSTGDYVITLNVTDGALGLGAASASFCIMGEANDANYVYCNMLRKVNVGSGVTSIAAYAFQYCQSLSNVTIPSRVSGIGNYAFQYCQALSHVTIPSGVSSIRTSVFQYCQALSHVTIPSGVSSIGVSVFQYCQSLSNVTIPGGVSSIGPAAFNHCQALSDVTIPSGVSSIGDSAFTYCQALSNVTIPSGVSIIGDYAFNYCCGVKNFSIYTIVPPTLYGSSCFDNIAADAVIHVPAASLNAYKTATNWAEYASKMVGDL